MSKKQTTIRGTGELTTRWEAVCDILGCRRKEPLQWDPGEQWILPLTWMSVEIVGRRRREDEMEDDTSRYFDICPAHVLPDFREADDDELEDMPEAMQDAQRDTDDAAALAGADADGIGEDDDQDQDDQDQDDPYGRVWLCLACGGDGGEGPEDQPPAGWFVLPNDNAYCPACRKARGL